MACYSVTKLGFLEVDEIVADILGEMTAGVGITGTTTPLNTSTRYFDVVFDGIPNTGAGAQSNGGNTAKSVRILKTTANIDPLATATTVGMNTSNAEPGWRICFHEIDDYRLAIHAGTSLQLQDSGFIAALGDRKASGNVTIKEPIGNIGSDWGNAYVQASGNIGNLSVTGNATSLSAATIEFNKIWLNRYSSKGTEAAYPMSYMLTMTNRGIFLAIWEGSQEEVPQSTYDSTIKNPDGTQGNSPLRWFLIQRSVDRKWGHVRGGAKLRYELETGDSDPRTETSRCPVFCVSGSGSPQTYQKFVVREVDVLNPSSKRPAAFDTEDSPALLNPNPQQSLTESGEFVVTFLNNLSTPRYRYADELDMLGTVGAEVIGAGTSVLVNVYDETYANVAVKREYTSLYSSERFGTGMRLMVLTKMGYNPDATPQQNQLQNIAVENGHVNIV